MKMFFAVLALAFAFSMTQGAYAAEAVTPVKKEEAVTPAKKEKTAVHKEAVLPEKIVPEKPLLEKASPEKPVAEKPAPEKPAPEKPVSAIIPAPAITAPVKPTEPVVLPVKPITMTQPKMEEKPAKGGGLLDGLKNMFKGKDEKKPEAAKSGTARPEEKKPEADVEKPAVAVAAPKKPQSSCGSENYLGLRVLGKEEKPLPGSRKVDLSKLPSGSRVLKQGESVTEKNNPKRLNLFLDGRNVIAEAFCG
jgi:hypothetical protein